MAERHVVTYSVDIDHICADCTCGAWACGETAGMTLSDIAKLGRDIEHNSTEKEQ